jgi:hypothetical protein
MDTLRSPGQKLIPIPVSNDFLAAVDKAMEQLGYSNRSQFIRDAIAEKLVAAGRKIKPGLAQAPSRAGKGGRPPKAKSKKR